MKEITILEPHFSTHFHCVGSKCIDHCCKEWEITFDKATTNKYLNSRAIEIKNIACDSIEIIKKSHQAWGKIKLLDDQKCGFLSGENLCKVHTTLGHAALSPTCSDYPRQKYWFATEINKTLSLSCPEAARLLLFTKDAMLMTTTVQLQKKINPSRDINQTDRLLNLMSMHLLQLSGINANQGLYAIASLLIYANNNSDNVQGLENIFTHMVLALAQGEIEKSISELKPDNDLKWSLLLRLQAYIGARARTRSLSTLNTYVKRLLHIQTSQIEKGDISKSIAIISKAWEEKVMPWLADKPYILQNYLMYRLHSEQFPNSSLREPLSALYLIVAEWFLIKSLIAATAEITGEITQEDVINIVYSYHAVTKHNPKITEVFFDEIDKVKRNDDISLIYLLK